MRRYLALLTFLLVSLSAIAQQSGMWGQRGISRAYLVHDGILYAADGRGLAAYDVRSMDRVGRVDVEWSDDETYDLSLYGDDELVVATSGGVERFSLAEDGTLNRLGSTNVTGRVQHIAAGSTYVAAANANKLTLLERNGTTFKIAQRITYAGNVTAVAFVGNYLYVSVDREPTRVYLPPSTTAVELLPGLSVEQFALSGDILWGVSSGDGLNAIDVSDPAAPEVIGNYGKSVIHLTGVAASGNRVYAIEAPDKLHVLDGTDPTEITLQRTINEWVNVVGASDTRVFFAGPIIQESGLKYDPGLIPRELGKPVRAASATNGSILAEYNELAGPVSGVWTDGSVAYVIDPPYFRVLDVSKTATPREVTSLVIPNLQDRIRVKNGLAVIYGRAYVNMLDVSDPLHPRLISTWDAQGHPPSAAAILQSRVIEANEFSGLHVVDFSNPTFPVQIGGRKWHYRDIAASDDVAYAAQHDIMLVVEIANEHTVVDRDELQVIHAQLDIVPPNSARPDLLLARGDYGLRLYSLEDRFHPEEIDFLPMANVGVFGTGDHLAYIAKDGRLNFVDLTKKLALQPTDMRVTSPMQMSVAGQKIVVADRYSVRVYGPDTTPLPAPPARRRPTRH
ncbi:MAG TPA: hypothetical protein VGD79_07480 [Thermoanaerobaculia bacterium]|jgi:hypothetical protein